MLNITQELGFLSIRALLLCISVNCILILITPTHRSWPSCTLVPLPSWDTSNNWKSHVLLSRSLSQKLFWEVNYTLLWPIQCFHPYIPLGLQNYLLLPNYCWSLFPLVSKLFYWNVTLIWILIFAPAKKAFVVGAFPRRSSSYLASFPLQCLNKDLLFVSCQ